MGRRSLLLSALLLATLPFVVTPAVAQHDRTGRAARASRLRAMGQAFLAAGDTGSAAGYFRDAISADRSDGESYVLLGGIYLERGSVNDALAIFSAGLRHRPDHGPLWRSLARALELSGDLPRASDALRELTARVPGEWEGHYARANLARRRQAHSEAQASYRAVIDLAAAGSGVPDEELTLSRRYAAALGVHLGEVDPVGGADRCHIGSVVRQALAGCR